MMPIRELVDTWASMYANSAVLRSGVGFMHVGALLAGGGSAVAADLGALRAIRHDRPRLQGELYRVREVHRLVIMSLAVVVLSGVLLMAADLDAYLSSTAFWVKMAFVVGLVINGAWLVRTTARAAYGDLQAVKRVPLVSLVSLSLWFLTTLLGAVLPNAL
jgi:hypothetical protein